MSSRALSRLVMCAVVMFAIAAACNPPSQVKGVLPGLLPPTPGLEFTESQLAVMLVCNDSLGIVGSRRISDSIFTRAAARCVPCIPMGLKNGNPSAAKHARDLWRHIGRAPHDTTYLGANCTTLAFKYAVEANPDDPTVHVDLALFRLASANDSIRALGITRIDRLVDSLLAGAHRRDAERVLGLFANGVWERAQRQLERPTALPLDEWEKRAHGLNRGTTALRQLPSIPRASNRYGASEAEWAARLYTRVAALSDDAARRSSWHRLALAPWVVLREWGALDSSARAVLATSPGDSAVLPARALAAYHRVKRPALEQPAVYALFDSAMRSMPRADSLRYDAFDELLTARDDEWRYGFLPSDRERMDKRGWKVLDPLWSTAVNEVRLARRARVAEADYRYADVAGPGQAGSETNAGTMFLRRGPFEDGWNLYRLPGGFQQLLRAWNGFLIQTSLESAPDLWRAFYGGHFATEPVTSWFPSNRAGCPSESATFLTQVQCARGLRADWTGVPFWGTTETIDVSVARFRARGDSTDLYIGARVPLRRFSHRDMDRANRAEGITLSAWLKTPLGDSVYQATERRELPRNSEIAWTAQWAPRTGSGVVMHRVEAIEPTNLIGARGAMRHTSDAQVEIALRGPGISDILVAAGARESRVPALRWTDYSIEPNGGVVVPRALFSLIWEMYDLMPAPDGRVRWKTSLHRETGAHKQNTDMRGMLQGARSAGARVIADEPDVPAMMYSRDAIAAPAIVEHMRFGLGDVAPGLHVVEVRIEDLVAKRTMSRSVSVRVLDPKTQERGAPPLRR